MLPSPAPVDDALRVASLRSLHVLDTPPEAAFDALVAAAASICQTPIALISLVDADRQWFKANHGLAGLTGSSRDVSFCARTVATSRLLEIEDASQHPDFANNPLVTGEPHIRFYAGAPIRLSEGHVVGALCVIDRQPRQLDAGHRAVLGHLAVAAAHALEGRLAELKSKAATAELQLNEARYRTLSDQVPVGVFQMDRTGACTYTNPRWQHIFGMTPAESLGPDWMRAMHPMDRQSVRLAWQVAIEDGRAFDCAFRILRPDQDTRCVRLRASPIRDGSGEVSGFVGSIEDVTRVQQLEAFLDRTGRLAGVGGWQLDLRTNVLTWSEQTKRIHEVPPDYEPMVEEAINFYAPTARATVQAAIRAGVEQGLPWEFELPLTTAAGRSIWVRVIGETEFDEGQAVRLIGAVKDVTAAHSLDRELQQEHAMRLHIQAQADETERLLAERSQMLDVLAHEVRQPLNNASAALQGATSALAGITDTAVAPRLSRARHVLAMVLASIDNTLAVASLLARPAPIERDDTDIDTLLSVAIADLPAEDRSRVQVHRCTTLRTASMDMSLMRLALRNLLSNAMRYGPPGSEVTLTLADCDEPLALLIDVADRGTGIPPDRLTSLFQRGANVAAGRQKDSAVRRERSAHGLGLGLYIVRRVIELHGGSVNLIRNGDDGVTMRLTLVQPMGD